MTTPALGGVNEPSNPDKRTLRAPQSGAMSSLRKKVSSYFRQLSFHNEPRDSRNFRDKRHFVNENTFVNKYLIGEIALKEAPPVLHGKTPNDLPNFEIGGYATGGLSIVGSATGPQGGLTTVQRLEKHLSIPDVDDIDFIDIDKPEDAVEVLVSKPTAQKIKVAGQTYYVAGNLEVSRNRKSLSLGSLTEEPVRTCRTGTSTNNNCSPVTPETPGIPGIPKTPTTEEVSRDENAEKAEKRDKQAEKKDKQAEKRDKKAEKGDKKAENFPLSKSKSAGSSLDNKDNKINNKKGKIIRIAQRPGQQGPHQNSANQEIPEKWDKKTDFAYGISDSLYDVNQVTKERNGNPIADCFGLIAREDSAVLGLADGVNWGEKAAIAAKSAVHGSLHYINKTVFDDTSLFNFETDSLNENTPINTNFGGSARSGNQITNTNDVFICLLRAFNSAHNLILENGGMLTTLTLAVVLPLKQGSCKKGRAEKYICCVCNLGDTFAYVYSPKCGIREITKGSHDITSNRDMRDALGALGPVDGINPELNNLTLSATTLEPGDIVLVASDGLTDNYDPSVCKFTVNQTVYDAPKHKTININPHNSNKFANRPPLSKPQTNRPSAAHAPGNKLTASNISRLASTNINSVATKPSTKNTNVRMAKDTKYQSQDDVDLSNPLVAQFIQDNAPEGQKRPAAQIPPYRRAVSMVDKENKKSNPLTKSSSTSRVLKTKTPSNEQAPRMAFLRSKTSLDLGAKQAAAQSAAQAAQIKRNEDGLPFVTPLQKYELTLLLMEDILVRGLSGREAPCVTARLLCENLLRYTVSITAAKRRTLEDKDLYYDTKNDVQVEVSAREKKLRRKKCLEKIQNLPGKLDHVTVVAYNVGNRAWGASAADL